MDGSGPALDASSSFAAESVVRKVNLSYRGGAKDEVTHAGSSGLADVVTLPDQPFRFCF